MYHSKRPLPASAGAMPRLSVTLPNFFSPGCLRVDSCGSAPPRYSTTSASMVRPLTSEKLEVFCESCQLTAKCSVVKGYMACSFGRCGGYSDSRLWLNRKTTNSAGLAGAIATSVMTRPRSMSVSDMVWPRPTRTR